MLHSSAGHKACLFCSLAVWIPRLPRLQYQGFAWDVLQDYESGSLQYTVHLSRLTHMSPSAKEAGKCSLAVCIRRKWWGAHDIVCHREPVEKEWQQSSRAKGAPKWQQIKGFTPASLGVSGMGCARTPSFSMLSTLFIILRQMEE